MSGTGVEGVTVVRAGAPTLHDVTLQAADGEILVVLGSSGSGKTTLLRVLAGLDDVSAGEVVIKGRRVTGLPADRRRTSMVFEAAALIPFLDVAATLGWGLRVQHLPEDQVQERIGGRARQFRLHRLLSRRPGGLSRGEAGLVGVGRALVQAPDVFLLDEPLAGLDPGQRTEVRRKIVEVVRSLGVTTFYVTHDQTEGLAVADRVALLHQGRVVQVGTPTELYARPVDLIAAGSIGTPPIGLLTARVVAAGGLAGFEVGARTLPLWRPVPTPLREHVGQEVVLGLRPEDVDAAPSGSDTDAVGLEAVVTAVEYTGRHSVVTMAVGASPVTAPGSEIALGRSPGATLRSAVGPQVAVRPGDVLRIAVEAARAHVFDAVSGRALWHPGDADDGSVADASDF